MNQEIAQRLRALASNRDAIVLEPILQAIVERYQNQVLTSAGLQIAAATSALARNGTAYHALVNSQIVRVAVNTNLSALTGFNVATGNNKNAGIVVVNRAGVQSVLAGRESSTLLGITLPQVPQNVAPVGLIIVETAGGATFTGGTTALDAANVTVAYVSVTGPFDPRFSITQLTQ